MRINKFVALATGISRRAADQAIQAGRVHHNDTPAEPAQQVQDGDTVTLDGKVLRAPQSLQTILLNKPAGFVVSRDGQGSNTVYKLLPLQLQHLKPVGRLDKDSSGLLLLTNDGDLAHELTHPSRQKTKVYQVTLNAPLAPLHRQMIADIGVQLDDGHSQLSLQRLRDGDETGWQVTMHEGRNRQIRRTFSALGYDVKRLHRVQFGRYILPDALRPGTYMDVA